MLMNSSGANTVLRCWVSSKAYFHSILLNLLARAVNALVELIESGSVNSLIAKILLISEELNPVNAAESDELLDALLIKTFEFILLKPFDSLRVERLEYYTVERKKLFFSSSTIYLKTYQLILNKINTRLDKFNAPLLKSIMDSTYYFCMHSVCMLLLVTIEYFGMNFFGIKLNHYLL